MLTNQNNQNRWMKNTVNPNDLKLKMMTKRNSLNSWKNHSIRCGAAELNERNVERKCFYFASDAAKMKKQKAACHVKLLKGRQPATTGAALMRSLQLACS
ncbi:hypothetical protein T10_9469 [Trichinella papuae]|uniref:Uncharacterized protein n=1 Tax=Trichinella papuae TaxID=268474 RepID=A0A0V1MPB5_9BILA|nr:hypothetical protein T10_9469 [Trichinella papuae]